MRKSFSRLAEKAGGRKYRRTHGADSYSPTFAAAIAAHRATALAAQRPKSVLQSDRPRVA